MELAKEQKVVNAAAQAAEPVTAAPVEDFIEVNGVRYVREQPVVAPTPESKEKELTDRAGKLFESVKSVGAAEATALFAHYKKRLLGVADNVLSAIEEGTKKKKSTDAEK